MFLRLASSYNWSRVRPPAPLCERCPPRWPDDMSVRDSREDSRASQVRARSLLTVRAAISSATSLDSPRCRALSFTCSYWRSRLALQARCGITSSVVVLDATGTAYLRIERCTPDGTDHYARRGRSGARGWRRPGVTRVVCMGTRIAW